MLSHVMHRLLIVVLLVSVIPMPPPVSAMVSNATPSQPRAVTPPQRVAPRPSLALTLSVSPDPLTVADTATMTLTVHNQGDVPADDVVVAVPVPESVQALSGPVTGSAPATWAWTIGHLNAQTHTTLTATLQLTQTPAQRAVVFRATARARDLPQPITHLAGALVANTRLQPSTATFTPGVDLIFRSVDGRVTVRMPKQAKKQHLAVRYTPGDGAAVQRRATPPEVVGFSRGLGRFALTATDPQGRDVHHFDAPLTVTVQYTQDELDARGIAAADLTLFWFDEQTQHWTPIPTMVDPVQQTATAQMDHFTELQLSDGSSPSAAYIPSLQGFQNDLFTGALSYRVPIAVPAGPGGMQPDVALVYNSAAPDGSTGLRKTQQAGLVGMGWNLSLGAVAQNKIAVNPGTATFINYYTLILGGRSYELVRAEPLVTNPLTTTIDPTQWAWRSTDESFVRTRVISTGLSFDGSPGRGGFVGVTPVAQPRYTWQVWTKDGTRYDFSEDLWWGWQDCGAHTNVFETYKWLLSTITDTHGNTITYTYGRDSQQGTPTAYCGAQSDVIRGTADRDAWPVSITWGGNPQQGTPARYQVTFTVTPRTTDQTFDMHATSLYQGATFSMPRDTKQLDRITVWSNPSNPYNATNWQIVREYGIEHAYPLVADEPACASGCQPDTSAPKLALTKVTPYGNAGTARPPLTFTYGMTTTTTNVPAGSFNRLIGVNMGQGGTIAWQYANVGTASGETGTFRNNRRVTRQIVYDGRGTSHTWTYSYGTPATNTLGVPLDGVGPQTYPNSAVLYYNKQQTGQYQKSWLAQQPWKEFRGHDQVTETDPSGATTEHFFYQGDVGCTPTATGTAQAIVADTCFQQIRTREFLKGREWKTVRHAGGVGSTALRTLDHTFVITDSIIAYPDSYGFEPLSGLWRAFRYESSTATTLAPPSTGEPAQSQTTKYFYNDTCTTGVVQPYGNLRCTQEYGGAAPGTLGALERTTKLYYALRDDATIYLVDRVWGEVLTNGQNQLQTVIHRFYDAATNPTSMGTHGDVTLERHYTNALTSTVLLGTDTQYDYDTWGNQTVARTFTDSGQYTTSTGTWSAPGTGSAARTTTTVYDPLFHVFPTSITHPSVNNVALVERADYDYRMGTLIQVVGPNGPSTPTNCRLASFTIPAIEETSCAQYDAFGRMTTLIKPGDSTQYPTADMTYQDYNPATQQPFRYELRQRAVAGQAATRSTQQFYNGLGKPIQIKQESADGTQNKVTDTVYDGLGRTVQTTQPRYVAENSTTFTQYTPLPTSGISVTTTTYDALDRPLLLTTPDGKQTEHHYGGVPSSSPPLAYADVIDPNHHRTQTRSDAFGRLAQVVEIQGTCGSWQYTPCPPTETWSGYATTTYTYDARDLLTSVTDAKGNLTSIAYDSAGRKTQMTDPDMGIWRYGYDPNGNLQTQTDAKNQVLWFGYDALDRLGEKRSGSSTGTLLASYGYDAATSSNGLGRRTSMTAGSASTIWQFDARGRTTQAAHTVGGLARTFGWTYDSGDRVVTMTYPAPVNETVTTAYDDAWRPTQLTSSLGVTYAANAQYSALDAPTQWDFGDGARQTWGYDPAMQRLQTLRVAPQAGGTAFLDRTYHYDPAGNIAYLSDAHWSETQHFSSDHRDRLTRAWTTAGTTAVAAPASRALASAFGAPGVAGSGGRLLTHAPSAADLQPDLAQTVAGALPADPAAQDATTRSAAASAPAAPVQTPPQAPTKPVTATRHALPLQFVENNGQTDKQVRFMVRGRQGTLFFTPDEAVLATLDRDPAIGAAVVRLQLDRAAKRPTMIPGTRLPGVVNEFVGDDPAAWKTHLPTYDGVTYQAVYPGIDLHYDGTDGVLKRTYHVAPGADPTQIQWHYQGATDVTVDGQGNLQIRVPAPRIGVPITGTTGLSQTGLLTGTVPVTLTASVQRTLTEAAPVVWQDMNGKRVPVTVQYVMTANKRVSLTFGAYDHSQPLIVDPVLSYATHVGGSGSEEGYAVTVNAAGDAYVVGGTGSVNFPTVNPQQGSRGGQIDAFVSRVSADGASYVWSTYLGGNYDDKATGVALDSGGRVAVVGQTESSNFPRVNAYDTSYGGGTCSGGRCDDVFATELAADGSSLRYSTYLGGSGDDEGTGVVVDGSGNLVLTGRAASGYPTKNAYDSSFNGGTYDMIITRINPGAAGSSSLLYSTFLGATSNERGYAIATAGGSTVYVVGSTYNSGFPTKNAYDSTQNGGADVLVVKLDPAQSGSASLLYSTYLGGSGSDEGLGIAADSAGNAYVTGYASSGFPTVNAAQATYGGGSKDVFVATINTNVSGNAGLTSSTYLGGSAEDQGTAITLTGANQVAITGLTRSDNYPTTNPTQATRGGDSCSSTPCEDALVTQLATTGPVTAQVTFSSYAGGAQDDEGRGIAHDSTGALYLTGVTFSATTGGTNSDAFLQKYTTGGGSTPPVTPQPYDETYTYDQIGNLLTKAGVGYQYGATGTGTGAGPHQARTVGLQSYQYDPNGNLLTGGGRALTWDTENRVASVTANGVTESATYDADGERVTKVNGAVTTVYLEGLWEETGGAVQLHYMAGSQLLAVRDTGTGAVTYLHSDRLGSVSLATTNGGSGPVVASEQLFTPWGQVRAGGIGQTTMNYTGQRLDGSGLLYYHARYYDPALARFVSADSVVPGSASGSLDGVALKPLTVDFHEPGFAATLAGENAQPFWFQMSRDQRQQADYQWGPVNPQALNRYSYVDNNPVNDTDATGHCGGDGIGSVICAGGGGGGTPAYTPSTKAPTSSGGNTSMAQAVVDIVVIVVGVVLLADGTQQTTQVAQENTSQSASPVILESRYAGDKRTAGRIINDEKKGSINSRFPKEWVNKTPDEIYREAKKGDRSARTAKKLLDGTEYDKDAKR